MKNNTNFPIRITWDEQEQEFFAEIPALDGCQAYSKTEAAGRPDTLIRITCRELEAFYMGDIDAVRQAFPRYTASSTAKKFRNPDGIGAPAEELRKITNGEYQKIGGSRKISPLLKLDGSNRSQSFNTLIRGITRVIEELAKES